MLMNKRLNRRELFLSLPAFLAACDMYRTDLSHAQALPTDPIPSMPPPEGDLYPRMAAGRIGQRDWGDNFASGQRLHDPEEVAAMAQCHFTVVNGQPSRGQDYINMVEDGIQRLTAQNPDISIYAYTGLQEAGPTGDRADKMYAETGPPGAEVFWGAGNNDWWGRDRTGVQVGSFGNNFHTNVSRYVTPDSEGFRVPQWYARRYVMPLNLTPHNAGFSVPRIHIYNDVTDIEPRRDAWDANGDGQDDGGNAFGVDAYQEGHLRYFETLQQFNPGLLTIGNCSTWFESQVIGSNNWPTFSSYYAGMLHGGWLEDMTKSNGFPISGIRHDGTVNPASGFGNFRLMMNSMQHLLVHTQAPKHVISNFVCEMTQTERNPIVGVHTTSGGMRTARWAFCCNALDDGYLSISRGINDGSGGTTSKFNVTIHIDEEGVVNQAQTGLTREHLGARVTPAMRFREALGQSSVWIGADIAGIHMSEFENGLVLVNSTKSDTGAITIPVVEGGSLSAGEIPSGSFRLIAGVQDTAINTGLTVNTNNFPSGLTIPSIDGRCLIRN